MPKTGGRWLKVSPNYSLQIFAHDINSTLQDANLARFYLYKIISILNLYHCTFRGWRVNYF